MTIDPLPCCRLRDGVAPFTNQLITNIMKTYEIDVIYTMKVCVTVQADNEEQAIRNAYRESGNAMPDEMECIEMEANITDIKDR